MSISCLQSVSTARLRHVDGFPVLGLLRRLRPRCARSPVASAIRPRGAETRAGSQVPPLLLVRCRSQLYPVWIPASGPYRLSRRLTSGCPGVPDAHPSIARRRSTSLATASPTSESVRNLLTGLRPSVRFPSPWRTRWPGRCSGSEVPSRPALTGSADLWRPGSPRSASPVCFSPHAAPCGGRGLSPPGLIGSYASNSVFSFQFRELEGCAWRTDGL